MFRNLFRRGVPALVLTFALAAAAPAAAADLSALDRWEGLWGWVVSIWSADEGGEGDRGAAADPDGQTGEGDRGAAADPNG
jgi:peptidoglycan/LPS O-acetylase OafA/YrhL